MRIAIAAALAACLAMPAAADPLLGVLDEARIGVLKHDIRAFGGVEKGADVNAELLFVSPAPADWGNGLPSWLRWVLHPRPHLGGLVNTEGATSQGYAGLTWTAVLAGDVFRDDDPLVFEYAFGGAVNDGYANSPRPDRKSLGSNVLFRLGVELGYRVTPAVGVFVLLDHESNGGLAAHNRALNNLGIRVGYRF